MERTELLARFAAKIPLLDKGFVRLVDVMGDDGAIIEAARVSTGKGRTEHKWVEQADKRVICTVCNQARVWVHEHDEWAHDPVCFEGDRRFLDYLMRQRHTSPFEQVEIKFHVKMPIFIARQWVRHRTASLNEYSGRYSEMIDDIFAVAPDGWRAQDTVNRQGSAGVVDAWPAGWKYESWREDPGNKLVWALIDPTGALRWVPNDADGTETPGDYLSAMQADVQADARKAYETRLAFGVSKELARVDLPLGNYTEWYWKIDLHNLLHFLGLRMDSHAQPEIQVYANAIAEIVKAWCPLAWAAYEKHRLHAVALSTPVVAALRDLLPHADVSETGLDYIARAFAKHGLSSADRATVLGLLGVQVPR